MYKKPREFYIYDIWDPIMARRECLDAPVNTMGSKHIQEFHVVEKFELDIMDKNFIELGNELSRQIEAFEYLVSMLPEECTAGFVTHARAIASGDEKEIERTK